MNIVIFIGLSIGLAGSLMIGYSRIFRNSDTIHEGIKDVGASESEGRKTKAH